MSLLIPPWKYANVAVGGVPLNFIIRDDFTTDDDTPITSPRTCEPGPGALTITDTGNKLAIVSGELVPLGTSTAATDPRWINDTAFSKVNGRAFFVRTKEAAIGTITQRYGFFLSNLSNQIAFFRVYAVNINGGYSPMNLIGASNFFAAHYYTNVYVNLVIVQRPNGAYYIVDDKLGGVFDVTWSGTHVVGNLGTGYTGRTVPTVAKTLLFDLTNAAWTENYGLAKSASASPASGDTADAGEADLHCEMKWTVGAGEVFEMMVRRTDDDNCWIIRCDQAAGTMKLIQKEAGTETERATHAVTLNAGTVWRIYAFCWGNRLQVVRQASNMANSLAFAYASASFNNTAVGTKVQGFATGSNYNVYNHTLPAAALAELQRYEA